MLEFQSKPVLDLSVNELRSLIEYDNNQLKVDILKGKVVNKYQAREYSKKLEVILTLEFFKSSLWKNAKQVLQRVTFWYRSNAESIERNKTKITEVKLIRKLKGQISLFEEYSLSDDEMKRAVSNPDEFIEELRQKNLELEKENKIAKFFLGYLMNHQSFFKVLYQRH